MNPKFLLGSDSVSILGCVALFFQFHSIIFRKNYAFSRIANGYKRRIQMS